MSRRRNWYACAVSEFPQQTRPAERELSPEPLVDVVKGGRDLLDCELHWAAEHTFFGLKPARARHVVEIPSIDLVAELAITGRVEDERMPQRVERQTRGERHRILVGVKQRQRQKTFQFQDGTTVFELFDDFAEFVVTSFQIERRDVTKLGEDAVRNLEAFLQSERA